jgi:TetR/AcrR family transcriptional repressor of nem operon
LLTKNKLLDAAIDVFIEKGFTRSSVDEICRRAGTTKGAFFHHFENKQEVGLLALDRYTQRLITSLREAPRERDPLLRILGAFDPQPSPACLVAVLTLELGSDDLSLREAARGAFERVLDCLEAVMNEVITVSPPKQDLKPRELAELYLATIEGALILARARGDSSIVRSHIHAFSSYLKS